MAEDLVVTAISNLISLYSDEVSSFESVNQERKKLESNLSAINSVLEDAEKKQLANSSDVLTNWLQKLHDAVYDLDDILDDCLIEDSRDEYEGDKSCSFLGFLHPNKIMFRHSIIGRMKGIRERLECIAKEKDQFHFLPPERPADINGNQMSNWRQTNSFVTEEIFGRKPDQETLVCHLLEGASHGDTLFVYPIVGLGGLGKTAIAQLVYHDERVTKHFDLKKWICVFDNFDSKTLLKAITKSSVSTDELDDLVDKLRDMLQGKRYLIVLDDIWNDDPDKWLELRSLLDCGAKGSVVLITTRLEKVAMMMRTPSAQPYHLTPLSEEDCWQVFRKRAFGSCIVQETPNLVRVGKDISRKCKGVPLAAKTLGGLLMFKADERFWIKIRDSQLWNIVSEEDGSIFAALKLSYLNLSPRARRCFSFCSIFPKDHMILKMNLVHLWMANGLISEKPGTAMELEYMGEEMVDDLYWRSLIQDVNRDPVSGNIFSFKMHDLVHDLAQSVSCDGVDALDGQSSIYLSPGTRHISIAWSDIFQSHNIYHLLEKSESIRSLVFLRFYILDEFAISNTLKRARLRALDFSGLTNSWRLIPFPIGDLKYLRYLNLSGTDITQLHDSIGSLWNLQTLNVSHCRYLETFPVSIGRLKNLQHLYNESCESLSSMPQSMVGLTSLRTLNIVLMGEPEKKYELQLSGLEHMKYLKGQLKIEHLDRARDVKSNLNEKQNLDDLCFSWDAIGNEQNQILILEDLRPPPKLRHLKLIRYKGAQFSNWMMNEIESFVCMQSLHLTYSNNCKQLPPLWKLPSLKKLVLDFMGSIRCLIEGQEVSCGEECVPFPALEVLHIRCLLELEKIVAREEVVEEMNQRNSTIFPHLYELWIYRCPKFISFNSGPLPSLRSLDFSKSDRIMLSMFSTISHKLQSLRYLRLRISEYSFLDNIADQNFEGPCSLQRLTTGTSELNPQPESKGTISSLEQFRISDSPKLQKLFSVVLKLASLRSLSFEGFPLRSLDTDTLTDLPSLKRLQLKACPELTFLPNWMNHLASLEELKITSCQRLTTLPDGIRQLSNLKSLYIIDCAGLKVKETEQDCEKIARLR